jgi:ribosomal protein S18 acetylase RimI-like enzyme
MLDRLARSATIADRGRVIDTFMAAFLDDPALRFFFPGEMYAEHAPAFVGALFDRRVGVGTIWVAEDGVSVAMWDGPGTGSYAEPPVEFDPPPAQLPSDARARLEAYDAAVLAMLPESPYWYLGVLATHPDQAGRGLGRAVTAAGLRESAAAGLPAYLETTNPANVDLYRRWGWQIAERVPEPLPIWVMVHPGLPGSADETGSPFGR